MKHFWMIAMTLVIMAAAICTPSSTMVTASVRVQEQVGKNICKTVTKKVHGKKKRVTVCTQAPAQPQTMTLTGVQIGGFTAVDSEGNIYADGGTHTLVKVSPAGQVLAFWDGLHFNEGLPDAGGGIALDAQGTIYIADQDADQIIKLSPNFQVLAQWGSYGVAPGQFVAPHGVALDAQGNVYVADTGNSRIQKLSPTGESLSVWDRPGDFRYPTGITVDGQNNVYVADAGHARIVKLSPAGERLAVWTAAEALQHIPFPADVVVSGTGNVYAADPESGKLDEVSSSGKPLQAWGADSQGIRVVNGLALDRQGMLYASECPLDPRSSSLCQIAKLSSKGQPQKIWKSGANLPAPGTKIDIGGYGLYLRCTGQGSPTVVMEAEYGGDASEWSYIQPKLAHASRVCSYDRAGHWHSDRRPNSVPSNGLQIARELHALLQKAGVAGPYVLAGHSNGGEYIRLFAYTYPSEVAGMVLIDSSHEDQCARTGDTACTLASGELAGSGLRTTDQQLRSATHGTIKGSLGNLPLIVLTQDLHPDPCDTDCMSFVRAWSSLQDELAAASSNSLHVMARRSGHEIPLEQPALVIEALREVVEVARAGSHALPPCGRAFEQLDSQCMAS